LLKHGERFMNAACPQSFVMDPDLAELLFADWRRRDGCAAVRHG
jgi:hypothetical protein